MKIHSRLIFFFCSLLLSCILLENTKTILEKPHATVMRDAAVRTQQAFKAVNEQRSQLGITFSPEFDPNGTGLIGIPYSEITTTLGNIESKRSTTNPNTAAMIVDMFYQLGLSPGDTVAVNMSGSFPALNIAVLCALDSCQLNGIVISSVGSSTYGANLPIFTYLDMEYNLVEHNIIKNKSLYFSMGGEHDIGDEMPWEQREAIVSRLSSYGYHYISIPDFTENVNYRMQIYRSAGPVQCCVNIGGNQLACSGDEYLTVYTGGIIKKLPYNNTAEGIIPCFLKNGTPVIQLLNLKNLFPRYSLPIDPIPVPFPGDGDVYREVHYCPSLLICLLLLNSTWFLCLFLSKQNHSPVHLLMNQEAGDDN